MASPAAKKILIEDFGYQPVDIESKSGYSRAVKETIVKLENSKPNDPRISILQDAIRPSKKRTTQPKKTKDDAVKFITGKGTPAPVQPPAAPMPKLSHTIKVKNPNTKVESEVVLEGLASFFG